MRAAHFGKTNPVSVLLDLGAPLSRGFGPVSTAQVGLSARAIAQQRGHTQVVERIDQVSHMAKLTPQQQARHTTDVLKFFLSVFLFCLLLLREIRFCGCVSGYF
eukprot:c15502_g1_i3.p2 GENE.c15502_g1_i3~~c15502_g1_i3.p2  ORF type:complete len:104 (+),score=13.97 c15502_g1_i3:820-1131(+)